jgi:hypothetical protein
MIHNTRNQVRDIDERDMGYKLVYEISFLSKEALNPNEEERANAQTARMAEVVSIAQKLTKAGWPIEWTVTGLAFRLPDQIEPGADSTDALAEVRAKLRALGITDNFRTCASRSLGEVVTARMEWEDRAMYVGAHVMVRLLNYDGVENNNVRLSFLRTHQRIVADLERVYSPEDLIATTRYQHGIVDGRRFGIRWLFGEDWAPYWEHDKRDEMEWCNGVTDEEYLDEEDIEEDEGEEDEVEEDYKDGEEIDDSLEVQRAARRQKRAMAELQEFLLGDQTEEKNAHVGSATNGKVG